MTQTLYVAVSANYWPDYRPNRLNDNEITDIGVGVFDSLEAAKRAFDERFEQQQKADEDYEEGENLETLSWHDFEDCTTGSYPTSNEEVLIYEMALNTLKPGYDFSD
jgi:hypothetical protein